MSRFRCEESKVFISNVITLRFRLIIDKKNFGAGKDGKLKSCDTTSSNGESSKLSEGTVTLISKIAVYKMNHSVNFTR